MRLLLNLMMLYHLHSVYELLIGAIVTPRKCAACMVIANS